MNRNRNREIGYDVVRCVAMLFVIALHTNPKPYQNGTLGQEVFLSVFYACNGMFFMLSGRFALAERLEGVKNILHFYKRKLFTLFIPFVFFAFLTYLTDLYRSGESFTLWMYLKGALRGVLGELSGGYLWFMFALIGFTISAPFLGRMVRNMSDKELHLLAAIGLIWEILTVYLGKNAGVGFAYNGWILSGWLYYYYLGYYVYRVFEKSPRKTIIMIAGLAALIINGLWTWKMPYYSYNAHDLTPLYTVYIVALYLFLQSAKIKTESLFGKIIMWVAAQSFFVYLIHRNILKLWLNHADWFSSKGLNYVAHFIVCAVCSVLVSYLFNLIYKPVVKKVK